MIHIFVGVAVGLFLCGCKRSTQPVVNVDQVHIELGQDRQVALQDICSGIELIPLETSDSILLSYVYPMVYNRQYYFRQNNPAQVTCFDSSGHFVYRINNKGRGDEEYVSINGMAGNLYAPLLYLVETVDYIDLYDLNGNMQQKIRLDSVRDILQYLVPLNRDTLLIVSGKKDYRYHFYSVKANRVFARKTDLVPEVAQPGSFFRMGKQWYHYNDNVIYEIKDTSFIPYLQFDFGEYNNTPRNYAKFRQLESEGEENVIFEGKFNIVRVVQGNEHYWFLRVVAGNEKDWKVKNVLYDKRIGKSYVFETLKEGFGWSDFDLLLENDFMSLYTPLELKEIVREDMLDEKNREIFQTIQADDNPVIVRFKLK